MTTKSALWAGLVAGLAATQAGCEARGQAWGEENAIIVVAMDSLWQQVGDSVVQALEPRFLTVREERAFNVTQISPMDSNWVELRRFRQVLSLGVAGDSWVAPALEDRARSAPYIVAEDDVWANDQRVTAVVVSPATPAADVRALLPELTQRMDSLYHGYAARRMYQSDVNAELAVALADSAGFSVLLPSTYRLERQDSTYVFRSWTTMSGELRRTLAVTWRNGVDTTTSSETLLAWRDTVVNRYMHQPQVVQPEPLERRRVRLGNLDIFELQGAWSAVYDGVPMGGAFITRRIACPELDRTYFADAWLYAPSREKYEYMIQLDILLNSFRCGSDAAQPTAQ